MYNIISIIHLFITIFFTFLPIYPLEYIIKYKLYLAFFMLQSSWLIFGKCPVRFFITEEEDQKIYEDFDKCFDYIKDFFNKNEATINGIIKSIGYINFSLCIGYCILFYRIIINSDYVYV